MNYHLQNGWIYDGSGSDGFRGDVLICNGKIEAISRQALTVNANYQTIDASGKWITPGFIDIHTHYDGELEVDASLKESVRHGVTTIFIGSCGISMVVGDPEELSDMFTRVEGMPSAYIKDLLKKRKTWNSPTEYFDHLDTLPLGPNIASFLGHSCIRSYVMGLERSLTHNEQPTKAELKQMNDLLNEALDVGYLGLSVNMLEFDKMDGTDFRSRPTPSVFADWKEYRHLFKTLRDRQRILQTIPNTANPLTFVSFMLESTGLFRKPLKTSMVALIDSKAIRGFHRVFGYSARLINTMMGGNVKFQGLPEPFDVTTVGFNSPFFEEFEAGTDYLHLQDVVERRELLADKKYRKKFRKQWTQKFMPRVFHRNLKETAIVSCPDERLNGQSFAALAKANNQDTIDYFLDSIAKYGDDLSWYTVVGNDRPEELNWIITQPDCHIGFSDAGAHLKNMAHYNFPLRMLKLVRDRRLAHQKAMTIGEAIRKLTSELADWYLLDRGRLAKGKAADVVIIDPNYLNDDLDQTSEEGMPLLPSFKRLVRRNDAAVPYVFVNGKLAWTDGAMQNAEEGFGKVLRVN